MRKGFLQPRARAVRPPLNIRGQQVADGIVEVATTLPARVEPAPAGARGGQEPVEAVLSELEVLWQLGRGSQDWAHLSEEEKELAVACAKAVLSDEMPRGIKPHLREEVARVSRLIVAAYRQIDSSEMLELDYAGIGHLTNICATEGLEPSFSLEPVLTAVADYQEVAQYSPPPSAQVARAALRWHSQEARNADSRLQLQQLVASDSGRAQLSLNQRCLCCGLIATSFCDACGGSLCQPCEYALGGMCAQCWSRCRNVTLDIVEVGPIAEKAVLVDLMEATWDAMRRAGGRTAAREHVHLLVGVASVSPSVIAARLFPDGTPLELAAATNLASVSMRSLFIRMVQDVVAQGLL